MNFPYKMEIQPYTKKDSGYMWSKPLNTEYMSKLFKMIFCKEPDMKMQL